MIDSQRFPRLLLFVCGPLFFLPSVLAAEQSSLGTIQITAGEAAIENQPVSVELPETGFDFESVHLVDPTKNKIKPIPAQIEKRDSQSDRLWWIYPGTLAAGKTGKLELRSGKVPGAREVTIKDTGKAYQLRIGNHPVLNYNYKHIPAPKDLDPLYGRSAHIHPIVTPAGQVVSDEFPPDHAHQSGQFLAYTKCIFEGRPTNFWEIKSNKGRVRFHKLLSKESGPVFAELNVEQEFVDLTGPAEKVALSEIWTIRVWNQPEKKPEFWMYDITSDARCATDSPLYLPEYHYGGMAIRGGRGWTKENCRFLTSNGKTRKNGNHDRSRWCDISGRKAADKAFSGFTILSHPDNFRFPEPVRIHPSMPYMVFTPSPLGDWKIEPGSPNISRYRFLVHDGLPLSDTDQIWQNYAHPPQVTFKAKALSTTNH